MTLRNVDKWMTFQLHRFQPKGKVNTDGIFAYNYAWVQGFFSGINNE